jgi:hypothetical protein
MLHRKLRKLLLTGTLIQTANLSKEHCSQP